MSDAVMPTYARADLAFERGEGVYLYGTDGRRFLDFAVLHWVSGHRLRRDTDPRQPDFSRAGMLAVVAGVWMAGRPGSAEGKLTWGR